MNEALKNQLREFYSGLLEAEAGVIALLELGHADERSETVAGLNATQDRLAELQRRFSAIRLSELGVTVSNGSSPGLAEGPETPQAEASELTASPATPA